MKNAKTLKIDRFRGVDFSTSPLQVKATRASEAVNFYLDDEGRMRKRPGWRERFCVRDEKTNEPLRINGIFEYKSGEHRDVIIHAGKRFFRVTMDERGREAVEDITMSSSHEQSRVDEGLLNDERSQAFFMAGKMYIIGCGDYLVYGSWDGGSTYELRRVYEGEDTYIPTTTVGIDGESLNINPTTKDGKTYWNITNDNGHLLESNGQRASLDDVSLLTRWRKNKLKGTRSVQSGADTNGEPIIYKFNTYQLDATIDNDSEVEVVNELTGQVYVDVKNPQFTDGGLKSTDQYWLVRKEDKKNATGANSSLLKGYVYKSIGYVTLLDSFPKDNGDSIITVKFRHTPTADEAGVKVEEFVPYEKRIGDCRFGVQYGIEGNVDRLFLSGNPAFDNVEFFSEYDDATYFPDLNTIAVGARGQAIVGYARLSDNTLAVFKERGNGTDACIFYHTGYYKDEADGNGNLARTIAIFPTQAGNVGQTVVSRHACADFGGDPLILSRDGVFGIVLSENIKTADRYTRERSRSVNARLRREPGLSEAVAVCLDGRYYLAVNSHVYVADARTKYYADKDADGSYQYEWWYWDGVPARVLCEVGGALTFGTEDGRVCAFDEQRSDRMYTDIVEGDLTVDVPNSQLDCDASLLACAGERIVIDTEGLYALYVDGSSIVRLERERVFVDESCIIGLSDGTRVLADGYGLEIGVPYVIDDVDVGTCSFRLLDASGAAVVPTAPDFRLHLPLSGRELVVCEASGRDFRVKLWAGGEALTLTAYDGEVSSSPVGRLLHSTPIRALWVSGVLDLGSASHAKTLLSISATAEPSVRSRMHVGYMTRRDAKEQALSVQTGTFSLADLSFREFSFSTGFAQSVTARLFERGINYIAFRVRSESGDCAIGALEAIYKFNGYQGGIR